MTKIRQPIITVAGHVDHGKTSILDSIRGTKIQKAEAGGITQKISFTSLPKETIQKKAGEVLKKFKIPLEIPGFLFIDTPGHAAFTNLRKRGGSLADIAILVIDINEGIKPQTQEVLQILKANKTPFIIALNKIDNISGWRKLESGLISESLENQTVNVKTNFDEKFYTLIGALNSHGFEAELYTEIKDFTKKIAVVPCSAETNEGISEILAMLSALSQKFLKQRIKIHNLGKGVILEVKKEKSINFLESIIYDGELNSTDQIAIASLEQKPITTKIRNIQEAKPLNKGFETKNKAQAAAGLRLQVITKNEILSGMPFQVITEKNTIKKIEKEFSKEISEEIQTSKTGIIAKADSLGSLEALLTLLKQKQIQIIKAGIGPITKKDIYTANSLPEEDKTILGFNVKIAEDVDQEEIKKSNVKILTHDVVYKIIDDFEKWKQEKLNEIEREKLESLPSLVKLNILDFVFRNSNPAVFGVKVTAGKLKQEIQLINNQNKKISRVKTIQEEKNTIQQAELRKEIAISLPGVNFERQLQVSENLYSDLSESQFRKFKQHKDLLTKDEKKVLTEIAEIKRKSEATWGI
ncbi:translation initiation factor IF-2 [Candidatus Pacearchaeota archaeon]|nr:translation initiation factor IF-2 [Candidatus Pacearchaeota archaeon]|tara:strand:- start:495 stop:2240 length:1746 start_codon:yes stop_codon:yes gene_type:complete